MRAFGLIALVLLLGACDRHSRARPEPGDDSGVPRTFPLGLPFKDGVWRINQGGPTSAVNAHVDGPRSQRRAADMDRVDAPCMGSDIVAIADGNVVFAVDGVPENPRGEKNDYFVSGNAVFLDIGKGLWVEYCHLKLRSVRVREGDRVKRGDILGQCGSSGNTTAPHLHIQIQDGPRLETALGVEGVFENVKVTRSGKEQTLAAYTFLRGDQINAR